MKILVWQWGRFGGGPLMAVELAAALRAQPGFAVVLSLARGAEICATSPCDWPVKTYAGRAGFMWRVANCAVQLAAEKAPKGAVHWLSPDTSLR